MRCETVLEVLERSVDPIERRFAEEHLMSCSQCRAAYRAVQVLGEERSASVPMPAPGAFERAMRVATQHPPRQRAPRRGFWLGAAVGGSLAAALALAVVLTVPAFRAPQPSGTPQVRLALNEMRTLHIALDTPEAMPNAQIRVALSGAIGLVGYDGQKEVAWRTSLDRGANELSLPVVVLGAEGGQLVVEVRYGDKRKRFLVDVSAKTNHNPA